jgi:hypothetical protein
MPEPDDLWQEEHTGNQYKKEYGKECPVAEPSEGKKNKKGCQYTIEGRPHIQGKGNPYRKDE